MFAMGLSAGCGAGFYPTPQLTRVGQFTFSLATLKD